MHVDNPLNQESSACVFDFAWGLHLSQVVHIDLLVNLFLANVLVYVSGKFSNHLWITDVKLVREDHGLADALAERGDPLLEVLGN